MDLYKFVRSLINMNRNGRSQVEDAVLDRIVKDTASFPQKWTYEPEHETIIVDNVTVQQQAVIAQKRALPCKFVAKRPGSLDEVEQMYMRALAGYEKALGPEHTSTLNTINNLGVLYSEGKLDEAEQMFARARNWGM